MIAIIPLALLLWLAWRWRRLQAEKIGASTLVTNLTENSSKKQRKWLQLLALVTFALLLFSWSNPQWGAKREKVQAKSADIFIALDISTSMYCEDIAPSRLDQAKRLASQLIQSLKGERIGLILFAGNAYLQMPLTTDYAASLVFVQAANPSLAGTQGTALGDAINTAMEGFTPEDRFHKVLVVITDGEDHDSEAITVAREANERGLLTFTVGVGTTDGSFIPITVNGNQDWKRDAQGQPVRTKLNETLLTKLAEVGGGRYFHLNNSHQLMSAVSTQVDQLEKREFEEHSFTEYESYFQVFLGLGIIGLIWQWALMHNVIKGKIYD